MSSRVTYGGTGKSENLARGCGCLNKSSRFEVRTLAGNVTRAGEASVGQRFDLWGGYVSMWRPSGREFGGNVVSSNGSFAIGGRTRRFDIKKD